MSIFKGLEKMFNDDIAWDDLTPAERDFRRFVGEHPPERTPVETGFGIFELVETDNFDSEVAETMSQIDEGGCYCSIRAPCHWCMIGGGLDYDEFLGYKTEELADILGVDHRTGLEKDREKVIIEFVDFDA